MKNFILYAAFTLLFLGCKQDKPVQTSEKSETAQQQSTADSAAVPQIGPAENPDALKIEPIAEDAAIGKTIFTQNGQVVIAFNTDNQQGKIKINGKDYPLNKLTFSENSYEIKGEGITITAENGDFQDMVSDCTYGNFPKININLNGKTAQLTDIKVQDCPNYN